MATLRVEGGRALSGRISVEGNKNSALPLIAACLLTREPCELLNVPRIRDVDVLLDLLTGLGATVEGEARRRSGLCASRRERRAGPGVGWQAARLGAAARSAPGAMWFGAVGSARGRLSGEAHDRDAPGGASRDGCGVGGRARSRAARPGWSARGVDVSREASVTGTETALLAAAAARGDSEIRHAATEPHVVELCEFLQALGVGIEGAGSSSIRVQPPARLGRARHTLAGDYIEAGSWGVIAAITGGEIEVTGARTRDLEVVAAPLLRMGLACRYDDDRLTVAPSTLHAAHRITTGLWPGFPSDMVSLVTVLATQAAGRTLVHDWLYELRLFALEQLSAMRADFFLCDSHRIIVTGPTKLRGRALDTRDLRSGMALIAAALAADGESCVSPLETVERGYARLVDRLVSLGAQVQKE